MIRCALKRLDLHIDLHKATEDWKEKAATAKTWKEFKRFFSKRISRKKQRGGSLHDILIANQVKLQEYEYKQNIVAQVQQEQEYEIEILNK